MLSLFRAPVRRRLRISLIVVLATTIAAGGIGQMPLTNAAYAAPDASPATDVSGGAGDDSEGENSEGAADHAQTPGEAEANEPTAQGAPPATTPEDTPDDTVQLFSDNAELAARAMVGATPFGAPIPHDPNFAANNLNRYFSVYSDTAQGTGGQQYAYFRASIMTVNMNATSTGYPGSSQAAWLVQDIPVPAQRTIGLPSRNARHPNSLAVTKDGVFFLTMQYTAYSGNGATTNPKHEYVDVWMWKSGQAANTATAIVKGFDLGPTGFTHSGGALGEAQQIVAGAFDPSTNDYYFGFYKADEDPVNGRIMLHLFRAEQDTSSPTGWVAGQVGVALTPRGKTLQRPDPGSTTQSAANGDIVFDGAGNLSFLVSATSYPDGPGNYSSDSYIGTITADDLAASSFSTPQVYEGFTLSEKLKFSTGNTSSQANGLAYTRSGNLVVQAGSRQRMVNPITFGAIASIDLASAGPAIGTRLPSDLASFQTPPTVKVQKDVVARLDDSDQFRLRLGIAGALNFSNTTQGTATGIQPQHLGPVGVQAGSSIVIGESMAAGSATTNLAGYAPTYACVNERTNQPITLTGGAIDSRSFTVPATGASEYAGPTVLCTITNTGTKPNLIVSKTSTPATGEAVVEGHTVSYALNFDNSTGTADATPIAYTDYLKDVLDDADMVAGSLKVRDVTDADPALHTDVTSGFYAQYDSVAKTIKTAGSANGAGGATVPAGKKYAVVYSVTVKNNLDSAGNVRESGTGTTAYRMTNFLVPATTMPPATCAPPATGQQPLCTDHPVKAWTVTKGAVPVPGTALHLGDDLHYVVTVSKTSPGSYVLNGITVTDDLSDVMAIGHWVPAANLPAGAKARGIYFFDGSGNVVRSIVDPATSTPATDQVPEPTAGAGWKLVTRPFDLYPGEVSAEVWFAIETGSPADGSAQPDPSEGLISFTNFASALPGSNEPQANQCRTGVAGGEPGGHADACEVTNTLSADFFTVRKDGRGTVVENGGTATENLQNLIGHEFELRTDNAGSMGVGEPANQCGSAGADPDTCWAFGPITAPGA